VRGTRYNVQFHRVWQRIEREVERARPALTQIEITSSKRIPEVFQACSYFREHRVTFYGLCKFIAKLEQLKE